MDRYTEFEGRNVDDCVKKACDELRVQKHRLKYDVLSTGSSGIFGIIGKKKARIRVVNPPIRNNGYRGSRRDDLDSDEGVSSLVDEAFGTAKPKPKKSFTKKKEERITIEKIAPEYSELPVKLGSEVLQKIVDLITEDAEVTVDTTTDPLLYNINGGNSAMLIGKRGQTLEAMQYLVDKIVNKNSTERIRVQIDVEGYLETRKTSLESLALRLAEKAKRTGKPTSISQMTAHDRRIVHLALKDDRGVRTQSMGDGYYRRLVIFPKKGYAKKGKPNNNKNQRSGKPQNNRK
jgi:spoIIIJ-associated protein